MEQSGSVLAPRDVVAFHAAASREACTAALLACLTEATSAGAAAVVSSRGSDVAVAGGTGSELAALIARGDDDEELLVVPWADGTGSIALHRGSGAFSARDRAVAEEVAVHAPVALAAWDAADDLARGLVSRSIIGQAQGILMERFQLDAERAFQVLRRYSQDGNVKLIDVARGLVGTRALPE